MKVPVRVLLFMSALVGLASCSSEALYQGKALIALDGGTYGELFREQIAVICYKDEADSVHISKVQLPDYGGHGASVGDSVEVVVYEDEIEFGKLRRYPYSIENTYLYFNLSGRILRRMLFDNGVLVIGDFGPSEELLQTQFFNYTEGEDKGEVVVHPIGFPSEVYFSLEGSLGKDTLRLPGFDGVFLYQPRR